MWVKALRTVTDGVTGATHEAGAVFFLDRPKSIIHALIERGILEAANEPAAKGK